MLSWIKSAWHAFQLYVLAEWPQAVKADQVLQANRDELKRTIDQDRYPDLPMDPSVVEALAEEEKTRRKTIEEKARGNLLALTVCSSLVFAGFSFVATQQIAYVVRGHNVLPLIFLFPIVYFIAAAVSAVKALEIGEFYSTTMRDHALRADALNVKKLNHIELNEKSTLSRANWATVSFSCLRNAVISLLLFLAVVAFALSNRSVAPKPQATSSGSVSQGAASVGQPAAASNPCYPCNPPTPPQKSKSPDKTDGDPQRANVRTQGNSSPSKDPSH